MDAYLSCGHGCLIICFLGCIEEREKPELLAESRERRIRVAEESGKTEQEVRFCSILICFSIPNRGANKIAF